MPPVDGLILPGNNITYPIEVGSCPGHVSRFTVSSGHISKFLREFTYFLNFNERFILPNQCIGKLNLLPSLRVVEGQRWVIVLRRV
jgi:hypothetical protein